MKKTNVKMNCKNCGNEIDVDELLVSQFEQSIRKDLEQELRKREAELNEQREEHKQFALQLERERADVDQLVNAKVKSQLLAREENLKEAIRKELNDEKSQQLQELENELIKKSSQLRELNGTKAQLERLRREMEEAETRIILDKEKELTERLEQARSTIMEQLQQESFLKLREREVIIETLKKDLEQAKMRADQSSMQRQGEAAELALEELLREMYPSDDITEVGKGISGADCIQHVKVNGVQIGQIIYESKNTKAFSDKFIEKIKQDNLSVKADLMIIVTKTMPKEVTGKFGIVNGVWVCQCNSIRELSLALRYGLLKIQSVVINQHGKETKMELLYNYISSEEFRATVEQIISGFKKIQDSHHDEKLKMQKLWKEREKILERVLASSVEFYASIKGIAGASVAEIPMLEYLPKAG